MPLFEACCWAIVLFFLVMGARRAASAPRFLFRFVLVSIAAWIGEQSCIEIYRFYQYSPRWSLFVGHVPLLVAVIWPAVILSAFEIADGLAPRGAARFSAVCGALILADASLIEPVSVQAGLWSWNEPGLFGVPPIGVLGWVYFSAAVAFCFRWRDEAAGAPRVWLDAAILVAAPLLTHLALLATWWGALRWINRPIAIWTAVGIAWALSVSIGWVSLRRRLRDRVSLVTMLLRVPPALLFLYLLLRHSGTNWPLYAWFSAFVPPYLTLIALPSATAALPSAVGSDRRP
ncbi:MAG: carotenoid biosynthesis protein [Myxococcales bacterium]|nr:carotenoid biosynthesis protein [Myxococcales bacterium]